MRSILNKISNIGIDSKTSGREVKRIRLINRILFLGASFMFIISPMLFLQGVYEGVIANLLFCVVCSFGLFLVSKGHPSMAIGIAGVGFSLMMAHGATSTPGVGLEYFLLAMASVCFVFFKQYKVAWGLVGYSVILFIGIKIALYLSPSLPEISKEQLLIQSIGLSILIFATLVVNAFYARKEQEYFEQTILDQKAEIEKEKNRSEELLLNILPEQTARELKENGEAVAKHFDMVTVLFTDFSDFTNIAEKMTAKELVDELHYCFKHFDSIVEEYNVEKIKTIGDSYMCAGGLPTSNETNPWDVVNAGLEMQLFMEQYKKDRIEKGLPFFESRIGIHTGQVVAGIVGIKKFAYDIWGDTVNVASRMESHGEVGKVNLSESTYELTKVRPNFSFTPREPMHVKGKGDLKMFFVELKNN